MYNKKDVHQLVVDGRIIIICGSANLVVPRTSLIEHRNSSAIMVPFNVMEICYHVWLNYLRRYFVNHTSGFLYSSDDDLQCKISIIWTVPICSYRKIITITDSQKNAAGIYNIYI